MNPTQQNERIHPLDILRGFALFGIIFVNVPALHRLNWPNSTLNHHYYYFLQIFVENKFFSIFSFLFGVGFYIFIDRALKKGENGFLLLAKRLCILLVFGIIHMFLHPGEALTVYAIYGFILLFAYKVSRIINLIVGLALLAFFTYITAKIFMPLPLILLGIAAGQYGLFTRLQQHYKRWVLFTIATGIISAAFVLYQYSHLPSTQYFTRFDTRPNAEIEKYIQLLNVAMWSAPFMSSFYVGLLVCLSNTQRLAKLLTPLQYFGRMALTNYLAQTALMLLVGKLLLSDYSFTYIQSGIFVLIINLALISLSIIILKKFNYGPMEKLWRTGTYWKHA